LVRWARSLMARSTTHREILRADLTDKGSFTATVSTNGLEYL
jgi:hypothetical protein